MLAYLSAGVRVAIFTGAALAYLGLLGFWEKAMTTVALLGAAALISITLGIPLGIYCARRPRAFAIVRPILDFMQSMPSFVYLIPVVAFIGSGKPASVVATMIFGSPPVIRFTVLGLQQVPEAVREAALAFGATPTTCSARSTPLAAPTIMDGVNQTILLSLAMVVVASLIGAKGLGEDVLEALQYAAAGQGILAGLAILFCALILDRIVTGKRG
ncbi:ABC transporter permease [Tropicimonas aquimaris]|uniref:ABC transporter permease n=1 Tax=Tropicimonas aquimaris TaxID=914152 RepID=A0ABW3IX16_9RHOB